MNLQILASENVRSVRKTEKAEVMRHLVFEFGGLFVGDGVLGQHLEVARLVHIEAHITQNL